MTVSPLIPVPDRATIIKMTKFIKKVKINPSWRFQEIGSWYAGSPDRTVKAGGQ
jgi:hypothetical protein